jgi:LmbE family N-acetylglucosaminyl deacetylase
MTTLILAAHPDDEVLGCGATAARLAAEGDDVFVGIMGEGKTSRHATREDTAAAAEVDLLAGETEEARKAMGVREVFQFGLPDNRFDTVPMLEVAKLMEDLIDRIRPSVVYTQHGGDLNVDHQAVYRAALTATRPVPGQVVREVYAFEVGSSTEWSFQSFAPVFRPNVFVDVSATIDAKVKAMLAYASEVRPFPHPRSEEAIRATALRWGSVAGVESAEVFELVRKVR